MNTIQSLALSTRVKGGLREKLANNTAVKRFYTYQPGGTSKKMRLELLDLGRPDDVRRWQELHNDKEHYEVLSTKESHQKSEYLMRVIFYELGDNLENIVDPARALDG